MEIKNITSAQYIDDDNNNVSSCLSANETRFGCRKGRCLRTSTAVVVGGGFVEEAGLT